MLKTLIFRNLILVEEAQIDFKRGFTVVTGETGAGKTALLEAIRLVLGERADSTTVRKGCEKAFIQASFEWDPNSEIQALLEESGIDLMLGEELLLAREITKEGKSRAFVSGQMVAASLLQKLSVHLIDFIGQHAQVLIRSPENQRMWLDQYAQIDLTLFQNLWEKEKKIVQELEEIKLKKETSESRKIFLQEQLEELISAHLQKGEEEFLFEEYTFLSNSQEILEHTNTISNHADEGIEKCLHLEFALKKLSGLLGSLENCEKMAKEAYFQLCEISSFIQSLQAKLENDPTRLSFLEERLKTLAFLKKKYGKNPLENQENISKELEAFENLDDQIEGLTNELQEYKAKTSTEATNLRKKRLAHAEFLGKKLSLSLRELNIPNAEVEIRIEPVIRSSTGEDGISFYLRANQGEQFATVRNGTSGGELSRLLFSLKILLAKTGKSKTLIFDEIDANIGGETASIIGKKLQELGREGQVLSITHFPQVARFGQQHLKVFKVECQGRTYSRIVSLSENERQLELLRMMGGTFVGISQNKDDEDHYLHLDLEDLVLKLD